MLQTPPTSRAKNQNSGCAISHLGLHCWLCHVRLREEPKERYDKLFYEMMEKQWEQVQLDLSRGGPAGLLPAAALLLLLIE